MDYKYALKLDIDVKNIRYLPDFVELRDYAIQFQTSDGILVPFWPNLWATSRDDIQTFRPRTCPSSRCFA